MNFENIFCLFVNYERASIHRAPLRLPADDNPDQKFTRIMEDLYYQLKVAHSLEETQVAVQYCLKSISLPALRKS